MGTDRGTRLNYHQAANHIRELKIYIALSKKTPLGYIIYIMLIRLSWLMAPFNAICNPKLFPGMLQATPPSGC